MRNFRFTHQGQAARSLDVAQREWRRVLLNRLKFSFCLLSLAL